MRNRKVLFLLGVCLVCTLTACGSKKEDESVKAVNFEAMDSEKDEDVLEGVKSFQTPYGIKNISDIDSIENIQYCYADIDGDGEKELCLKGTTKFSVIKECDGLYKEIYYGDSNVKPIDKGNQHGIYVYQKEKSPAGETIKFDAVSVKAETSELIFASWHDEDGNGTMDETDKYFLDRREEEAVTKEEWVTATKDYVSLKEANIEWKKLS